MVGEIVKAECETVTNGACTSVEVSRLLGINMTQVSQLGRAKPSMKAGRGLWRLSDVLKEKQEREHRKKIAVKAWASPGTPT
jgi:hypothetical protein